jgi:hypothetical protein
MDEKIKLFLEKITPLQKEALQELMGVKFDSGVTLEEIKEFLENNMDKIIEKIRVQQETTSKN